VTSQPKGGEKADPLVQAAPGKCCSWKSNSQEGPITDEAKGGKGGGGGTLVRVCGLRKSRKNGRVTSRKKGGRKVGLDRGKKETDSLEEEEKGKPELNKDQKKGDRVCALGGGDPPYCLTPERWGGGKKKRRFRKADPLAKNQPGRGGKTLIRDCEKDILGTKKKKRPLEGRGTKKKRDTGKGPAPNGGV